MKSFLLSTLIAVAPGPDAKDVTAGERGSLSCGETVTGVLDPATDSPLPVVPPDNTVFDLWEIELLPAQTVTLDAQSADFDTFLFLTNGAAGTEAFLAGDFINGSLAEDDDGGDGTNSRITVTATRADRYGVAVNQLLADGGGAYTLTATCEEVRGVDDVPAGDPSNWNYLYAWDGIYFQPGNALDEAVPGQGLALDIQRGVLFGALFSYDEAGQDAFLTIQGSALDDAGRNYAGRVFRTRDSGGSVEDVGSFTIQLINRAGNNALRFTIDSPYLDQVESEWVRFGYVDVDAFSIWAGNRISFAVLTDDPDARALLDELGSVAQVSANRQPTSNGTALAVAVPSDAFNGVLFYDPTDQRFVLGFVSTATEDSVTLRLVANEDDWVGTATVARSGSPAVVADVVGFNVSTARAASKSMNPLGPGSGMLLDALIKRLQGLDRTR